MAPSTVLNQTFGESEEEDDDFNPQPVGASDDENDGVEGGSERQEKPLEQNSAPKVRPKDVSDDEGRVSGLERSRERSNGRPKDNLGEGGHKGVGEDNGEDDEGEGENLHDGLDEDEEDDDEDEDEDEDEEAVSVGLELEMSTSIAASDNLTFF